MKKEIWGITRSSALDFLAYLNDSDQELFKQIIPIVEDWIDEPNRLIPMTKEEKIILKLR